MMPLKKTKKKKRNAKINATQSFVFHSCLVLFFVIFIVVLVLFPHLIAFSLFLSSLVFL